METRPFISYIFFSEFDLTEGSSLRASYPESLPASRKFSFIVFYSLRLSPFYSEIADYMLPEQGMSKLILYLYENCSAHSRPKDTTFFILRHVPIGSSLHLTHEYGNSISQTTSYLNETPLFCVSVVLRRQGSQYNRFFSFSFCY